MRKLLLTCISLLTIVTLLAACGPAPTEAPPEEVPEEAPPEVFKVGMVTDVGGIDDKSFNATSWHGMELAEDQLGVEVAYLESQQQTDYAVNIAQFLDQEYDMIITVGFLLGEDTAAFAQQNPDTDFAIVDYAYDPVIPNVLGLTFATDEAAFLAGYAAAGMTKTGKVGTFGGIEIPPVTIFMVGFKGGVDYYNEVHGTNVEVLGMDLFVGNFESTDDGRRAGEDLIAEGADIVMPVAGPVGLGTAAAVQENPGTMLIGVDTDWCVSAPEYCEVTLTSVLKNMDVAVLEAIRASKAGTFEGGFYVGTLANDGVGIASFNEFEDDVPADLKAELADLEGELSAGNIATGWGVAAPPPEEVPAEGVTIIIGTTDKPATLDPADCYGFPGWEFTHQVADGLLNNVPGTSGDLELGLAADWPTVSDDGLEYTFKLREGVTFPDGTPFNADAVMFSIQDRVIGMEETLAGEVAFLVSAYVDYVEKVDDYTVKFVLQSPVGFFPQLVATNPYKIVNPNTWSTEEYQADNYSGGIGRYVCTSWKRDEEAIFERNATYYGTPAVADKVIVRYFADAAAMALALENGEIDVAWKTLLPADLDRLGADPDFVVEQGPGTEIRYVVYQCQTDPISDPRVRQALALCLDRAQIADVGFQGTKVPLYSMVPPGFLGHKVYYPEDPDLEQAKALLAEAGFDEANPLVIDLWWSPDHYGDTEADVVAIIKDNYEATGVVQVNLQNAEWATYKVYRNEGTMPVFLLGWYPDYLDSDNYTWPFGHSTATTGIGSRYNNPDMDALLEQAAVETDNDARAALYEQIQEKWFEENPTTAFAQGALYIGYAQGVTGITLDPLMQLHYFLIGK